MMLEFQVKAILIAFAITVVVIFTTLPIIKRLSIGEQERDDGPKSHQKKKGTPTMGGIAFIISMIITVVGLFIYYKSKEIEVANSLVSLLIASICFGIVGLVDDLFKEKRRDAYGGLSPKLKMLMLIIVSTITAVLITSVKVGGFSNILSGTVFVKIPFVSGEGFGCPAIVYTIFSILVMIATTNAVNLTDGVDGLAGSVSSIIFSALTIIAIIFQMKGISIYGSVMVGMCIAYLLFNLYPAKLMMGDTGSLLLGGTMATMALAMNIPFALLLLAIIPVLETLSDIIQVLHYKRTKKRIFKMAPLHHHFELSGWKENKVVLIFDLITVIGCIIGVYSSIV